MFAFTLFAVFLLLDFEINNVLSPWAYIIIVTPFLFVAAILLGLARSDWIKQQWKIPTKSFSCGLVITSFSVLTFDTFDLLKIIDEWYTPIIRSLRQNRIIALSLRNLPDSFANAGGTSFLLLIISSSLICYAAFSFLEYRKTKLRHPQNFKLVST